MGRRNTPRPAVHKIILMGKDGAVSQTYELDEKGKLKQPVSSKSDQTTDPVVHLVVQKAEAVAVHAEDSVVSSPEQLMAPLAAFSMDDVEFGVPLDDALAPFACDDFTSIDFGNFKGQVFDSDPWMD